MWPFKKKKESAVVVKKTNPKKEHFLSFTPGQKAFLLGKEVIVMSSDGERFWNDEFLIPEIEVGWWNRNTLKTKRLTPNQVFGSLKHQE